MIPIGFSDAFSIYVCSCLAILCALWFRDILKRRRGDWDVGRERLYKCDKCHLSFLTESDSDNVTRCPRCNEMCFIRKRRKF